MKKWLCIILCGLIFMTCERITEPKQKKISIVYVSYQNISKDLFIMDMEGRNKTKLTNMSNVESPCLSFDDSRIVFIASEYLERIEDVFIMNIHGSDITNLTSSVSREQNPRFSANGSMIVFESEMDGNNNIFRMNSDGSNLINLTNNEVNNKLLDISIDSKILFSSYDSSKSYLHTMFLNGSGLLNLDVVQSPNPYDAKFSSDGKQIVFCKKPYDQIAIISSDGSGKTNLTEGWNPQFFMNNKRILYLIPYNYGIEFYSINIDGTNQINLTNSQSGNLNADILSDGSKIVFQSYRDGNSEIYIMNEDGSDQRRLTYDSDNNTNPLFIEILE